MKGAPAIEQDLDHLRLLSIFHCVLAGVVFLFGCLPFVHLAVGIAIVTGHFGDRPAEQEFNEVAGWLFIVFASVAILFLWIFAALFGLAGRSLSRRRRYGFCIVVAALECLMMPIGTILGVFTLIVLTRPSVKALFEGTAPG